MAVGWKKMDMDLAAPKAGCFFLEKKGARWAKNR
jgi:hypothetical protein